MTDNNPHPESKWTHPICKKDYAVMEPDREPVSVKGWEAEICCWCGEVTISGIFYRADPDVVHPSDSSYLTHLKAIDIPAWQYRTGDWFTCQLFTLMAKADENNFNNLAQVFPTEAEAFKWWKSGAWEKAERAKESTSLIGDTP